MVARTAVVRDRKLAEPLAPNRLPEEPPPKPAPMSAPRPCCSNTSPMIASAITTWNTTSRLVQSIFLTPSCLSLFAAGRGAHDRGELTSHQRSPADQAAVDIRHAEQL